MTIEEEIKIIHKRYKDMWLNEEFNSLDNLFGDLLNELEDLYNPSRLNGN